MSKFLSIGARLTVAFVALTAVPIRAEDWPAFRGPRGDGTSNDPRAPVEWGSQNNVLWKTRLPRPGNGSPIVSRGHVLVTSAEDDEGKRRSLYCFDRKTGEQRWVQTIEFGRKLPTHVTNPYCGTTPVSDGERVVVWHASAGLHCYSLDGVPIWSRDLGEFQHMWGYGSSPILYQDRVFLFTGPGKRSFFTALDAQTGKTLWETEEPTDGTGELRGDGKYMGAWTTPVVALVEGQTQLILPLPTRINGYDPRTGSILWSCDGVRHDRGDLAYSSATLCRDLCFVTGGYNGPAMAFRPGGSGNITESRRLWRTEKNPQSIGSAVYANGHVFRPNAEPGTIEAVDPLTGQVKWTDRGPGGVYWASIVMAGELLYATNQDGATVVFRPNPEAFEPVATNSLDEATNATPAISEGQIFFRTAEHLWAIGSEPAK